ncbi:putative bifunctional diguanylate cyclase/phosphodiesterase [Sphingomonas morindae]|uniref:GGDEF and EAL domain-containing protein n=1 Tax=Sphingomonas morindae TaxID=1541170 RepID=A0ABY4X803_9SPHN|nr:GGDEF and EAL domain-containing protein [Sphingomonas morindae]USI73079.1 GGDEF and EAL domain-containing protein [Sphingomonas morindae]
MKAFTQRRHQALARARRDLPLGALLAALAFYLLGSGLHMLGARGLWVSPGALRLLCGGVLSLGALLLGWRRYRRLVADTESGTRVRTPVRTDELTGFHSRRTFAEDAAALLRHRPRRDVAMLVVDLDHFRTVNEVHGHLAGDEVLRGAADTIRRALPPDALAGRLDGDRFAIALPFEGRHASVVDGLADFLVGTLAQPIVTRGVTAHLGASVGLASAEGEAPTVDALLRRSTIAMRAAKRAGGGRATWFDAAMEQELIQRNSIERGLREGIPRGEIIPFYEPQVELESGRLLGFEVLARWDHPSHGIISPDLFIPVAEESGLIGDLSMAVMRRAFTEARDWDSSLALSVNISPAQLRDPWLAQKIVKLLVETGFPPSRLEVEITESSLFQNLPLAQTIIGSLKNQGIRLALDDFGTGYSSLAHLRALPFDRIKIDRSFVMSMIDNAESAAIVDAISKLGESLNMPVTAEGIEDERIRARLTEIGCAKGQGWHFGKPMTVGAARRLLAERGLLPAARAQIGPADTGRESEQRRAGLAAR